MIKGWALARPFCSDGHERQCKVDPDAALKKKFGPGCGDGSDLDSEAFLKKCSHNL
jgi:hypothetical protein